MLLGHQEEVQTLLLEQKAAYDAENRQTSSAEEEDQGLKSPGSGSGTTRQNASISGPPMGIFSLNSPVKKTF